MSAATPRTRTEPDGSNDASGRTNGLTDEQVSELLAAAGRRKDDPGYLKRLREGVAEYRREIQKEVDREMAEQDAK
ncbi:MAG TPA: hypothetical protein VM490_06860 [Armatimonadaceae bacterium]|nr:hypothetical protein [Armatimonadaceae bacterium]